VWLFVLIKRNISLKANNESLNQENSVPKTNEGIFKKAEAAN
jgi:hypothetical protein